jgi:hypothetical protein
LPLPQLPLSSCTPNSWNSSTGIIFVLTCMCTHFLHRIHSPTPFPHHLPTPTSATPPPWAGPAL